LDHIEGHLCRHPIASYRLQDKIMWMYDLEEPDFETIETAQEIHH